VRRLNPAFVGGRIARAGRAQRVLVPRQAAEAAASAVATSTETATTAGIRSDRLGREKAALVPTATMAHAPATFRTHTVRPGESIWRIAHRYGLATAQLLARNGLDARSVLQPGMVLALDAATAGSAAAAGRTPE